MKGRDPPLAGAALLLCLLLQGALGNMGGIYSDDYTNLKAGQTVWAEYNSGYFFKASVMGTSKDVTTGFDLVEVKFEGETNTHVLTAQRVMLRPDLTESDKVWVRVEEEDVPLYGTFLDALDDGTHIVSVDGVTHQVPDQLERVRKAIDFRRRDRVWCHHRKRWFMGELWEVTQRDAQATYTCRLDTGRMVQGLTGGEISLIHRHKSVDEDAYEDLPVHEYRTPQEIAMAAYPEWPCCGEECAGKTFEDESECVGLTTDGEYLCKQNDKCEWYGGDLASCPEQPVPNSNHAEGSLIGPCAGLYGSSCIFMCDTGYYSLDPTAGLVHSEFYRTHCHGVSGQNGGPPSIAFARENGDPPACDLVCPAIEGCDHVKCTNADDGVCLQCSQYYEWDGACVCEDDTDFSKGGSYASGPDGYSCSGYASSTDIARSCTENGVSWGTGAGEVTVSKSSWSSCQDACEADAACECFAYSPGSCRKRPSGQCHMREGPGTNGLMKTNSDGSHIGDIASWVSGLGDCGSDPLSTNLQDFCDLHGVTSTCPRTCGVC